MITEDEFSKWFRMAMEQDPDVLEYWDQPWTLTVNYVLPSGRRASLEEWNPTAARRVLVAQRPYLYSTDADGRWRCLPAERAEQAQRLRFAIHDERRLPPMDSPNLQSFLSWS